MSYLSPPVVSGCTVRKSPPPPTLICRTVAPSYCPASLSSLAHYVHVTMAADQPPPSLMSYADGWRSHLSPSSTLPPLSENISIARDISPTEQPRRGYKRPSQGRCREALHQARAWRSPQSPCLLCSSPSSPVSLFPSLLPSLLSLPCSHRRIPLSPPLPSLALLSSTMPSPCAAITPPA